MYYAIKRDSETNRFFAQSAREECAGDRDFATRAQCEAYIRECEARDKRLGYDADDE